MDQGVTLDSNATLKKPATTLALFSHFPYKPPARTDTLGGTAGLFFSKTRKLQFPGNAGMPQTYKQEA